MGLRIRHENKPASIGMGGEKWATTEKTTPKPLESQGDAHCFLRYPQRGALRIRSKGSDGKQGVLPRPYETFAWGCP